MIKILRPPSPEFLSAATGKWSIETAAAITHYAAGPEKSFDFQHYRDEMLKKELEKIFIKCAYCESVYNATSDGDVEHFRPKGRVDEKDPKTPGYYWLANDWDNLMLACTHCNQRRRHEKAGEESKKGKSWGKLDQFPLMDEKARVTRHTATKKAFEKEEKARLLLHPCKDDPEKHFGYDATTAAQIYLTPMAEKSANVFVLWRRRLVLERNKRRVELFARMEIVKEELERLNEAVDKDMKYLKKHMDRLLELGSADQPYAGMSRFFIRQFLQDNNLLGRG